MAENVSTEFDVKENQVEYLTQMAEKHGLPDPSKALRCLLTFAMQESQHESSIFSEIRCANC